MIDRKAQLKLLFRFHWRGVPVVGAVKVWNDADHALLDRDLHLLQRQFLRVSSHRHTRGATGNRERHRWHKANLACVQQRFGSR